jgi:hypothetical protein
MPAHSEWLKAAKRGDVVGIIVMDLSAAFDTNAADKLLPKLERLGIRGQPLSWFTGYMTGGMGAVVWNSEMSEFTRCCLVCVRAVF